MMPNVFVVLLNWNRSDLTIDCLSDIAKQNSKGFDLNVVVVDNASSDDSVAKIRKFLQKTSKVKYQLIVNEDNLGFAAGNNVGIAYAIEQGADYVCLLNNDTILDKNLLSQLLSAVIRRKKAGAVSPKIYFAKGYEFYKERYKKEDLGKVIWYAGGVIDWDNVYGSGAMVDEVDRGGASQAVETDYATGACMFLSAKALRDVGNLDEKYFMYYEDTELSCRLKKAGYKVLYAPQAVLWHKVAQSSGIGSDLNDYFITRNRLLFGAGQMLTGYAPARAKAALIREAVRLMVSGRKWQKIAVKDYFLCNYGKGSWASR